MQVEEKRPWWFYSLLIIPILLLSFLGTVHAAEHEGSNYLKGVTLHNTSGEGPSSDNQYLPNSNGIIDGIHENSTVRLYYEFEFPDTLPLVAGDTLTFGIPEQMRIGNVSTPKSLRDGNDMEIGTYTIANDEVTITMNSTFVQGQNRTMFFWVASTFKEQSEREDRPET